MTEETAKDIKQLLEYITIHTKYIAKFLVILIFAICVLIIQSVIIQMI